MTSGNILGIDPGLATIGYAVISPTERPRKFKFVTAGTITTSAEDVKPVRLAQIYEEIIQIVEQFSPIGAGIEEVYYSKNKKTAGLVSEARGVILHAVVDLDVSGYSPLEVKKNVTGYGQATKQQVKIMIKKLLNLSQVPSSDDATDAIGVALCKGLETYSALNNQLRKEQ